MKSCRNCLHLAVCRWFPPREMQYPPLWDTSPPFLSDAIAELYGRKCIHYEPDNETPEKKS